YNNFSYKYFNNSDNVIPFEPFQNELPAFYLGFEEIAANMQISLYFAIKEISNNETPSFKWEYYDRTAWKELFIENDETKSFQKSGIVNFIFPHEIKKNTEFGKELFWIRVEPSYIRQLLWPELKGIFPNTVWASNHITVNNEILGSGNGMPGQSFSLSRRPVLCGHVIEIKEGENWIKWNETGSFALSNKLSRDYVIDRTGGMIFFGDGIHGMALPKGKNNIRAGFYRSGGGNRGNQEIGAINTLRKANPDIELVTNHVPSFGGEDEEDNEHAVFRGPNTIKNRGYAVTAEDFEWLALEASTEVLRAKCVTDKKNRINIIILPDRKDEAPLPEISLKDSIGKYLKERAFFAIREKIYVLGPDYKRIDSETTVRPLLLEESSIVSERIKSRLRTFFDPVRGGRYGKGYDFGQKIYLSEVAAVIEDIEGVECVEDLILKKIVGDNIVEEVSGSGRIDMEKNALPRAGNIEVKIGN
ncbi:MAG TPA: putative baseplate assembly protein, partial [Candidatus Methanoperedens sp.]